MNQDYMQNYKALAAAIVRQAMDDYQEAIHSVDEHPRCRKSREELEELDRFFSSDYYHQLLEICRL